MGDITTVGLDLAKNVFQVHAVDEAGSVVVSSVLSRRWACTKWRD
jgi:transposase